MPFKVRSSAGRFPVEELINQCDFAVKAIDETVISVGQNFESKETTEMVAVIQSPLAVLERNIQKLREVQTTVEQFLNKKDPLFCGTRFTKQQVADWTFRGVDYLAAFVAVALIIMETSDTASKFLGETDVPKGFTAALVMVSKVLSAATDYRNKQKLEREKFLGMLKDVEIKCQKIEEAAAIYNVFRSISALKNQVPSAIDPRSNCKDAVKLLKGMPDAKIQGDLAKNLKKQLSSAIEDGAKDLIQERFRVIFDRKNPINIKRRLYNRWYQAVVLSNRMSKIYRHNRFMLLEDNEKLKFVFKNWAHIILNRKKILERSQELLGKRESVQGLKAETSQPRLLKANSEILRNGRSIQGTRMLTQSFHSEKSRQGAGVFPQSFQNEDARQGARMLTQSFHSEKSRQGAGVFPQSFQIEDARQGAGVFPQSFQNEDARSFNSQNLSGEALSESFTSDEDALESVSLAGSVRRHPEHRVQGGYRSGSNGSIHSTRSSKGHDHSIGEYRSQTILQPYGSGRGFFSSEEVRSVGPLISAQTFTVFGGGEWDSGIQQYPQNRDTPRTRDSASRDLGQEIQPPTNSRQGAIRHVRSETIRSLSQSSSRRPSNSSDTILQLVQHGGESSQVLEAGNLRLESSLVFAPGRSETSQTGLQGGSDPVRLNLPPVSQTSNSLSGENSGYVVLQMPSRDNEAAFKGMEV
jgi:hypothetical protein